MFAHATVVASHITCARPLLSTCGRQQRWTVPQCIARARTFKYASLADQKLAFISACWLPMDVVDQQFQAVRLILMRQHRQTRFRAASGT